MEKNVIVIGGGIVGLSCAYYLHKAGHQVTVLDQSGMDSGASYVNAGYLTPSHIVPLAAPGVMAKGLKWMFNSSSPFYLKPRIDLNFLTWSWNFHRSATPQKVAKALPKIAEINLLSKALYTEILSSGDLGSFQLETGGLLMYFKSEKAAREEREVLEQAHDLGLDGVELTLSELESLQPGLSPDITGAFHYRCDAHTTPNQIMGLLKRYLTHQGVSLLPHTEVVDFVKNKNQISSVITNNGSHVADEVVLAAGTWSGNIAKKLNHKLVLEAGKGYRIDINRPTPVTMPALLMEAKVAVTPMSGFTRFAGTMELSGINHKIRKNRVEAIAKAAGTYYQNLDFTSTDLEQAACGLRPVSPDGLPYIGRLGAWKNVTVGSGHAMMGWSLGPVTGKLITDLISDQKPLLDLAPYNPQRSFR
jgi:D-amino-acid dehydrogenase